MVTNSKEYMREWRAKNADKIREYQRNSRYKQYGPSRQAAIDRLGGRCFHCGFDDVRCLDVDHVFGGGTKERARKDRIAFYKEIVAGLRPDTQLLCLNCHRIKTSQETQ
jgi:5-methylcytosine-specific restriction endonuclease McrA